MGSIALGTTFALSDSTFDKILLPTRRRLGGHTCATLSPACAGATIATDNWAILLETLLLLYESPLGDT